MAAAVIGRAYLGNHPSFDAGAFTLVSSRELWLYAVLGILCALWAAFFVRGLYWVEDRFEGLSIPPAVKAAAGVGLVGLIGTAFPQVLGLVTTACRKCSTNTFRRFMRLRLPC